mgnify:FL=1
MPTIIGSFGSGWCVNAHRAREYPKLWATLTEEEKAMVDKLAAWESKREQGAPVEQIEDPAEADNADTKQAHRLYLMAVVELQRMRDVWEIDDLLLSAMSQIVIRRVPVRSFEEWIGINGSTE